MSSKTEPAVEAALEESLFDLCGATRNHVRYHYRTELFWSRTNPTSHLTLCVNSDKPKREAKNLAAGTVAVHRPMLHAHTARILYGSTPHCRCKPQLASCYAQPPLNNIENCGWFSR